LVVTTDFCPHVYIVPAHIIQPAAAILGNASTMIKN